MASKSEMPSGFSYQSATEIGGSVINFTNLYEDFVGFSPSKVPFWGKEKRLQRIHPFATIAGKYLAFAEAESMGSQHLSQLAESGITHVQCLGI